MRQWWWWWCFSAQGVNERIMFWGLFFLEFAKHTSSLHALGLASSFRMLKNIHYDEFHEQIMIPSVVVVAVAVVVVVI